MRYGFELFQLENYVDLCLERSDDRLESRFNFILTAAWNGGLAFLFPVPFWWSGCTENQRVVMKYAGFNFILSSFCVVWCTDSLLRTHFTIPMPILIILLSCLVRAVFFWNPKENFNTHSNISWRPLQLIRVFIKPATRDIKHLCRSHSYIKPTVGRLLQGSSMFQLQKQWSSRACHADFLIISRSSRLWHSMHWSWKKPAKVIFWMWELIGQIFYIILLP